MQEVDRDGRWAPVEWTGVQVEPEEALQGTGPDVCLVELTGAIREVYQTTLCNTG